MWEMYDEKAPKGRSEQGSLTPKEIVRRGVYIAIAIISVATMTSFWWQFQPLGGINCWLFVLYSMGILTTGFAYGLIKLMFGLLLKRPHAKRKGLIWLALVTPGLIGGLYTLIGIAALGSG